MPRRLVTDRMTATEITFHLSRLAAPGQADLRSVCRRRFSVARNYLPRRHVITAPLISAKMTASFSIQSAEFFPHFSVGCRLATG